MTSNEVFQDVSNNKKPRSNKLQQYVKDIVDFMIGFKNAIIVLIIWILVGEIAGYSIVEILGSVLRLLLYPLSLLLFGTEFNDISVPEVFFLLIPLVTSMAIGFIIIISTED